MKCSLEHVQTNMLADANLAFSSPRCDTCEQVTSTLYPEHLQAES